MKIRSFGAAIAVTLSASLMSGCGGVEVSKDKDSTGIPFNVRKPVVVHGTSWAEATVTISVQLKTNLDTVVNVPDGGVQAVAVPTVLEKVVELDALVAALKAGFKQGKAFPLDAVRHEIGKIVDEITAASAAAEQAAAAGGSSSAIVLISNTRNVETVLDADPRFLVTTTPLIGSSDTSLDLGPDGTMTKTETKITDDTTKTILSMLPINALVAGAFGLPAKVRTAQSYGLEATTSGLRVTGINFAKSEGKVLYVLKRIEDERLGCGVGSLKPALSLNEGKKGENCVQLVSMTSGEGKTPGKEKPAYVVSGTVTPPDASGK